MAIAIVSLCTSMPMCNVELMMTFLVAAVRPPQIPAHRAREFGRTGIGWTTLSFFIPQRVDPVGEYSQECFHTDHQP